MTTWVSIENDVPPHLMDVLLCGFYTENRIVDRYACLVGYFSHEEKGWWANDPSNKEWAEISHVFTVTHWTLLPEAPK
jgi:hypothetical protein